MRRLLSRLRRDEEAATAVEYAVMLALILIAVMTAINAIGSTSSGIWANDTSSISSAISGS